ncbi:MAG TPA: DUF2628 domain-containing protein [Aquifex aeolicus]|nr:DUF2628 domain-containing protein [Aquifex aeolicus]
MEIVLLSLYAGSLFLLVSAVAPVLLRTEENKNVAGRFYGRILWRFYGIAFFLLVVYLILSGTWVEFVLLVGLSLNVITSMWLKKYKRKLGNIEEYDYNSPERTLFRRVSWLSTVLLAGNLVLTTTLLMRRLSNV